MKTLLISAVLTLTCVTATTLFDLCGSGNQNVICSSENVTMEYRWAIANFIIDAYKLNAYGSNYNFVFCPFSIWLMLAEIAEGTDPVTQKHLFKVLYLPDDVCDRQKYYQIASTRIQGLRSAVSSNRVFGFDYSLQLNPDWLNFVLDSNIFSLLPLPIKSSPDTAAVMIRQTMNATYPTLNLTGNSVLLDAFDYNGIWDQDFAEVNQEPFYGSNGTQIGYADLMRTRRYARMSFTPTIQSKVLELPIGSDGRYVALFAIVLSDGDVPVAVDNLDGGVIFEILANMRPSLVPIDIALPKFSMTFESNVRRVFENLGVRNIWTDPSATRLISQPPAAPSSFQQRTTVTLNPDGVSPYQEVPEAPIDAETGLDPRIGRTFIANEPILWGIFDTEVYTCLMASAYSQPPYPL